MKNIYCYFVCSAALIIGVMLLLFGGVWSVCGLAWLLLCYLSGELFPMYWRRYWAVTRLMLRLYKLDTDAR